MSHESVNRQKATGTQGKFGALEKGEPSIAGLPDCEQSKVCAECGGNVDVDEYGVINHLTEDGGIDYDADGNHVAINEDEIEVIGAAPAIGSDTFTVECPDCGTPMVGQIENGITLPGTECQGCPHVTAVRVVEVTTDDGRSYEYTFDDEGTIRVRDEDGDTVEVWYLDDAEDYDAVLPVLGIKGGGKRVYEAIVARDNWNEM